MTEYGPIGVEHLTNKRVDVYTLQDMVDDFYMNSLRRVLYIVLSPADYWFVGYQVTQGMLLRDEGKPLRLQQFRGMYISVDSRLPRGDLLLLYEDK